jgi:hypothetical protein
MLAGKCPAPGHQTVVDLGGAGSGAGECAAGGKVHRLQGASEEVSATTLEGSADAAEPDAHNKPQPETLDAFLQSPP